ncbi:uncharacterized protein LOC127720764 [Mytilus californianus]|uniref:uncharacterized protein LOC127720764 n=1 Tax=Mytilus californianus TaxID=6549 RepID=UPI002244FEFF|nr:uncharacterized protein LOC127720764 [Mytilus californianus]
MANWFIVKLANENTAHISKMHLFQGFLTATVPTTKMTTPGHSSVITTEMTTPTQSAVKSTEMTTPGHSTVKTTEMTTPRQSTVKSTEIITLGQSKVSSTDMTTPGNSTIITLQITKPGASIVTSMKTTKMLEMSEVTSVQPIRPLECLCPCSKVGKGKWDFLHGMNLTLDQLREILKPELDLMKKELSINKSNTTRMRRSKISAPDDRVSAASVGYVGVVFICLITVIIVFLDMLGCIVTKFKKLP